MPRGQKVERQPVLFPVGDLGPPDGPVGPAVACAGAYDDDDGGGKPFNVAMAGFAWLLVKAYTDAQIAAMDADPADV